MTKIIFIFCCLSLSSFAQNKTSHKKYTMDFIGGYYTNLKSWKENGVLGGYEFSYMSKTIVYSANISMGFGISKNRNTKDGYIQAFLESDLLAGKKINLTKYISIIPQKFSKF